jgi:hypothetical protein
MFQNQFLSSLRETPFTRCQQAPVDHALPGTFIQGARS